MLKYSKKWTFKNDLFCLFYHVIKRTLFRLTNSKREVNGKTKIIITIYICDIFLYLPLYDANGS